MISKKQKKKKKLRHAEYYGMTETFDKLYAESRDGKVFTHLYELVTAEENILLAYRNIKRNKGSTTAGVDRKTILDLDEIYINAGHRGILVAMKSADLAKALLGLTIPVDVGISL